MVAPSRRSNSAGSSPRRCNGRVEFTYANAPRYCLAHDAVVRWYTMDTMERYFIAMAVIGFVGLIASVVWMLLG
jgi:hypothetical protein